MSGVALDLSPSLLLAGAAALPLTTILFTRATPLVARYVPLSHNSFAPPGDGLDTDPPRPSGRRTWQVWALVGLAGAQAVGWEAWSVYTGASQGMEGCGKSVDMLLVATGWTYATASPLIEPTDTAPFLLFAVYLQHLLASLLNLVSTIVHPSSAVRWTFSLLALAANAALVAVTLSYPLEPPLSPDEVEKREAQAKASAKQAEPEEGDEVGKEPLMPSPERTVTLGSWLMFAWVSPLMSQATKRKLQYPDVWQLPKSSQAEAVYRSSLKLNKKTLLGRIFWNSAHHILSSVILMICSSLLSFAAPFCLNRILRALSSHHLDPQERTSAFIYAFVMFLATYLRAQADLLALWASTRAQTRTQSLVMQEVYVKALKRRDLSGATEDDGEPEEGKEKAAGASNGKIAQLMSQDSLKLATASNAVGMLAQVPFELFLAIFALYKLLGWTCFIGLMFVLSTTWPQTLIVKWGVELRKVVLAARDDRTEKLTELINSIRFIKYSASEPSWLERVFNKRETELAALLRTRLNNVALQALWNATPNFTLITALGSAALIGKRQFDVSTLFTAISVFQLLENPLVMLPRSFTQLLEGRVSLERVEAFLAEEEVEGWVSGLKDHDKQGDTTGRVGAVNGSFRYDRDDAEVDRQRQAKGTDDAEAVRGAEAAVDGEGVEEPTEESTAENPILSVPGKMDEHEQAAGDDETGEGKFKLRDITVDFPVGELSLVCGPTGSGKTSLLMALLGEMICTRGQVHLPKCDPIVDESTGLYNGVAYAAQLPFLQHQTIEGNITFGSTFEQDRYDAVIDACALTADFAQLEAGDQTEIGEKGISLSGGQKARVALARAVYSRAKTVLLDDPLSAVDSHTAKHLFGKCLKGQLLEGRTVILVTHHVALCLQGSAYFVELRDGTISLQGQTDSLDHSQITHELLQDPKQCSKEDKAEAAPAEKSYAPSASEAEQHANNNAQKALKPGATHLRHVQSRGKLITDEAIAEGRVARSVYMTYLNAVGWDTWILFLVTMVLVRAIRVGERVFFSYWGSSYRTQAEADFTLYATHQHSHMPFGALYVAALQLAEGSGIKLWFINMPSASDNVVPWLLVYVAISVAALSVFVSTICISFRGSFRASRILFTRALTGISRAPFRYWDTTPTGRVINRFAGDIETIDMTLTEQVRYCLDLLLNFLSNIGIVVFISPWFIIVAAGITAVYLRIASVFVRASRDLRRLTANARSPLYSSFSETLQGLTTVRAFGSEQLFLGSVQREISKLQACTYAGEVATRYLSWRFDLLGATAVLMATLLALGSGASPGMAAVSITSAQGLIMAAFWLCRLGSQLEVDLNSVERVVELLDTPEEPAAVVEGKRPPASWPSDKGGLVVEDLVLSYAEGLPAVIKGVSFEVEPKEKIGLVGRTGSGKSTMALALLRFTEPTSGKIILDGVDITTIGLSDLRSRLMFIPQEAVLFSGTVRSNLDPFSEHTDAACFDALARVGLNGKSGHASPSGSHTPSRVRSQTNLTVETRGKDAGGQSDAASLSSAFSRVSGPGTGRLAVALSDPVSAGGLNFSAGQRQLLAMARALLRRSKVIIMDEATASVDMETDELITRTIQEEFEESMVLCIAHRLRTIISFDKVLVLDNGKVLEYDSPRNLLLQKGSAFRAMAEASSEWAELKQVAGVQ